MADASKNAVGSVRSLWRYPVKSMIGEEVEGASLTERGLRGDRAYAVVDGATGKVGSAKNPREWGNLLRFKAAFVDGENGPAARITFPDGSVVSSQENDIEQRLSVTLSKKVKFAKTPPRAAKFEEYWPDMEGLLRREKVTAEPMALGSPPGTFFDFAQIHVLSTATLSRLRALYPQGRFETARFRPNIVVETISRESAFAENDWVGCVLGIGEEVRLNILIPCPRCVMTTLAQGDLPSDLEILRTVAKHNRVMIPAMGAKMPSVGVYAAVLRGGTIRRGDPIRLLGSSRSNRLGVFARAYWRLVARH